MYEHVHPFVWFFVYGSALLLFLYFIIRFRRAHKAEKQELREKEFVRYVRRHPNGSVIYVATTTFDTLRYSYGDMMSSPVRVERHEELRVSGLMFGMYGKGYVLYQRVREEGPGKFAVQVETGIDDFLEYTQIKPA